MDNKLSKIEEFRLKGEKYLPVLFNNSYDLITLVDVSATTLWANQAWKDFFGAERDYDVDSFSRLHPDDLEQIAKIWKDVISRSGRVRDLHYRYKMPDDTYKHFESSVFPVLIDGEKYYYVVARDVTERKKTEEALEKALHENKALIKELQHRTKNSFSLIMSMIGLMEMSQTSREVKDVLVCVNERIKAVTEMYNLMFYSDTVYEVKLNEYVGKIINSIANISLNISLHIDLDLIVAPVKIAIPIGMIVNELLTNAFKYAFPDNRKGNISVTLRNFDTRGVIEIVDDGVGLPDGLDIENTDSLGLTLVRTLTSMINGTLHMEFSDGIQWKLEFPVAE